MSGLGRRVPSDWEHYEKWPLTATTLPAAPVPVVFGVNWYSSMDWPEKGHDGRWWIGRGPAGLGSIRGGHCICAKPTSMTDPPAWWDFYDQGVEGSCLRAGTLIRMGDGTHKRIEDVRPLDVVVTAEGRPGRVSSTHVRFHEDGLIRIALVGHRHLKLTAEHPLLTTRGYVAAGDLRIGDEVALTRYLPESRSEISIDAHVSGEHLIRQRTATRRIGGIATVVSAPPDHIQLTPAFGRLVGLFLAEGSTTPNKVQWTFGGHERETLVEETVMLVRETLNADARIQARPNGVYNVVLYGKAWRVLFESLFRGDGAYEKKLGVADGPRDYLEAVLDGWLSGDGYERRTSRIGVTVSHRLALDMYAIAQGLGRRPTIRYSELPNRRGRWDVEMATGGATTRSRESDVAVWRKVAGIEREEYAGFVFNFEVEGDNSYVAEGVGVHNCVGFGSSRMMTLLNRLRYDARWLYNQAQLIDEWADTPPEEGTSVRAGLSILKNVGHSKWYKGAGQTPDPKHGIAAYRWASTVDEVYAAIQSPLAEQLGAIPWLNSWGRAYPHIVWVPEDVVQRLIDEDGEVGLITDR